MVKNLNKFYFNHKKNISSAYIWISGGSSLDKINQKGMNQILCSLITRGSKYLDNFEISKILDDNGAELCYEAVEDGIYLGIKSLKEYFKNVYPLIEILLYESILPEREFIKCKKVQINNILKNEENLFIKTFDNWKKLVYKNHPYRYDCNGYTNTINNINYEDITKEYNDFRQRNMYLLSNHEFIDLKHINIRNIKDKNKYLIEPLNFKKEDRYIQCNFHTNQIVIMLGNKTCPHNNKDYFSLKLLESYLAFGMSSILFKMFREKNGLTYDIGIIHPVRIRCAPFLIYLSVSKEKALTAFKILVNLWKELSTKLIPKKDLDLAKTKLKSSLLHSSQLIEDIILRKVQLISYQMDHNFDKKSLEEIDKISPELINVVINKYLNNPFLSILGDSKVCEKIKNFWETSF